MRQLGLQAVVKMEKPRKNKTKSSKKKMSRFRAGHWLTTNEIEYIISALSDATAVESQARPYDYFIREYQRELEGKTKSYPWRLGVINTDDQVDLVSTGYSM